METRPRGGTHHHRSAASMNLNLPTQQQQQQQTSPARHHNDHLAPSSSSSWSAAARSPPPPPSPPPPDEQSSRPRPPHLAPMMDYAGQRNPAFDTAPHRVTDVYPLRPDVPLGPPREQLPPLSSLFDGPRLSLSSRAPYADRSPTFPLPSPPHPLQTSAHGMPEQKSWEVAYSPRRPSPPTSSPNVYNPRASQAPGVDLSQHPPRPTQLGPSTSSPRLYDSRYSPKESPRTQLPRSRNGWSPRTEPPHGEYFPPVSKDGASPFRPLSDQKHILPHPQAPEPRTFINYSESTHGPPAAASFGSDLASNPPPELGNAKDGLGPKIWTGTQFLPRFIRQAEVPGEGICYFYDDGTHCRTHIDGEAVNAHWGVTKAGKPRKRLAIACITCREKKIKCDPDYPRCTQCEKFGRVCKFKNAPRGGQGSPEITPEPEDLSASLPSVGEPARLERREDSRTYSVHSSHRQSSVDSEDNPQKRAKFYHPTTILNGNHTGYPAMSTSPRPNPSGISRRESDYALHHASGISLDADQDLAMELVTLYFQHKGASAAPSFFPEEPFMLWFTNRSIPKSSDDLMLIHTLLAMATIYSSNPLHRERGKEFAAVGRYACDQRHYSLQLVQSRLLLSLYYLANNRSDDTWDFCGAALRAATVMKLNLEMDMADLEGVSEHPYHLHRDGYRECRRRTFWACYVLDKLHSFSSGNLSNISSKDVFLRLPCDAKSFEEQVEVKNPYFKPSPSIRDRRGTVGSLGYLINICAIWEDVMANIYRYFQRPDEGDEDRRRMLSFHSAYTTRLKEWSSSLSEWLSYSPANLSRACANGEIGSFITMHSLHHSAQMTLNRHLRPDTISQDQLERSIRAANEHAEALLQMADHLATRPRVGFSGEPSASPMPFSAPFIGHAIISAVDIVTAKGHLASLPSIPSKLNGAMAVINELCSYWESARQQRELINVRKMELVVGPSGWRSSRDQSNLMTDPGGEGSSLRAGGRHRGGLLGTYEMDEPMEKMFARGTDCIYGVSLEVWDRALAKEA